MMLKIVPSECVDVCGPVCIFMQGHRSSSGWDMAMVDALLEPVYLVHIC